ncbi:unnamed protein product, partial [Cyprideis torosa]
MGNERRENIPARTAREFPGNVKIRKISLRKREITPDPEKKAGNLTMDKRTPSRAKPMLDHPETHTAEKPLSCSQCDARFSLKSQLVSHEKTHSVEKKPFQCSHCDARFARKASKVDHEKKHTEEKPFCCSYCGARFLRRNDHKRHELRHTGEKSFSCSRCNARFFNTSDLRKHVQRHVGVEAAMKDNRKRDKPRHFARNIQYQWALHCLTEGYFKTVVACEEEG